ncbi:MAG: DMT family transporter [Bacteroidetes bacterium]|nr:MAG: DMT family transporter [Bacteroidota bacterium]
MIYLLLSIACSTFIFVIFKWFGKFNVNNLQAIVANYFIAGTLGWLPLSGSVEHPESLLEWGVWPFAIGFLFITLFQLMAKITQDYGVNVVSVTVKMSFIIPILFGVWMHGERLSTFHIIGILLAILAVYSINKPEKSTGSFEWKGPLILFVGSGVLDATMKIVESGVAKENHLATFTSSAFAVAGILGVLYLLYSIYIQKKTTWDAKSWLWGIVLGIPNYGSIFFLLKALGGDFPSAILYPINNVGIVAISAVIARLFFAEYFTKWRIIGLVTAAFAILSLLN